jgi:hypothetical protein
MKWNLSPGGRPGKLPRLSPQCARGDHTQCRIENCLCTGCGHPAPVTRALKKAPEHHFMVDTISKTVAS